MKTTVAKSHHLLRLFPSTTGNTSGLTVMTISNDAVGLVLLEGVCRDLRAQVVAQQPPKKSPAEARGVVRRMAARAKMVISLLGGICLSLSTV